MARKSFSTTMDEELLRHLKATAAQLDRPVNDLLEEAARRLLDELWAADLDGGIFAARAGEPEEDALSNIEARLARLKAARV